MKAVIGICALGIALLFYSHAAMSQNTLPCGSHSKLTDNLQMKYGEFLVGGGGSGESNKLQLYINPTSGSFTFLRRLSDKISCLIGSGEDWKFHKIKKPGRDT